MLKKTRKYKDFNIPTCPAPWTIPHDDRTSELTCFSDKWTYMCLGQVNLPVSKTSELTCVLITGTSLYSFLQGSCFVEDFCIMTPTLLSFLHHTPAKQYFFLFIGNIMLQMKPKRRIMSIQQSSYISIKLIYIN